MAWRLTIDTDTQSFLKNLQQLDDEVVKGLDKQIKKGARVVRNAASRNLGRMSPPLSGWALYSWIEADRSDGRDLQWNTSAARRGYAVGGDRRRKSGVFISYGVTVEQRNAQGAIFELAGLSDKPYRGSRRGGSMLMRANINKKRGSGPRPRVLYPAYYEGMTEARRLIQSVVEEAERRVNRG